jgi:hypothetical protein
VRLDGIGPKPLHDREHNKEYEKKVQEDLFALASLIAGEQRRGDLQPKQSENSDDTSGSFDLVRAAPIALRSCADTAC